ncbi:MAG: redoxin domain-containing protein [Clostridiales bacterium]|nr:redoxin domain-containing protein [Clostridiales bacterium]
MKKRLVVILTAVIMLLCVGVALVACGGDEVQYSVTVLGVDETPQKGVKVSWKKSGKTQGSATTGSNGKATAKLEKGTYSIALSGIKEGFKYKEENEEIVVGSSQRDIELRLEIIRVNYTVTVLDKNGANAKNVTVTWATENSVAGTAITDNDGKAECELDYGTYTITVSNLPAGNVFTDNITVTGKNPAAHIELNGGETVSYTVAIRSEGGLKFKNTDAFVYSGTKVVHSGKTNEEGNLVFSLPANNYTVTVLNVQDGYKVTKKAALTAAVRQGEVVLSSSVILSSAPSDKVYKIGDIIHDFEFTTPYDVDGSPVTYSIAELVEQKEAVIINNWGINCSWCVQEMPAMEEMYQLNSGRIEVLAISNYNKIGDTDSAIIGHREQGYLDDGERKPYTFPMMRDNAKFYSHVDFAKGGWPTTVVVDRYGAIAHIESGAILSAEIWQRLVNKFIGPNYKQTFTPGDDTSESVTTEASKPDIFLPDDHYQKVAEAINDFEPDENAQIEWSGETENDMIWPFILKAEENVSDSEVLCAGNSTKPNSMAAIYASVKMPVGKVLVFDYYAETEKDYDVFSVIWDGKIIKQISDLSGGWKTCYLYTELTSGNHMLALAYKKDSSKDVGLDNVYIRRMRFEPLSVIDEPVDMLRGAAYGLPENGADRFPHYAEVELAGDGYYHVKLNSLQNSEYAGVDSSPMLFVNMTGATNWVNEFSISELVEAQDENTGEYVVDCRFTINGETRDYRKDLLKQCQVATASDIEGFLPVDRDLYDLLTEFMKKASGTAYHDKTWLEACYFYSHYGDGSFVGNPIIGLTNKTAITVSAGEQTTADITRIMAPLSSVIYTFTPAESAVYKFESLLPEGEKGGQIWLYDDETDDEHPLEYDGDDRFIRDRQNEQNFTVYRYLTAGHKYYFKLAFLMQGNTQVTGMMDFVITNVGQEATQLVPTSAGFFNMVLAPDGETILGIELAGTVKYVKDNDGYYHAVNSDGTMGDFIYLDVKYPTRINPNASMSRLAELYVEDPEDGRKSLDYKMFDFRYTIAYYSTIDVDGDEVVNFDPKFDLTKYGPTGREFKDYTDIFNGYVAKAENGLVKVDDQLMNILQLYIETRVNMLIDSDGDGVTEYEAALENEWLRFCWYNRVHNAANP